MLNRREASWMNAFCSLKRHLHIRAWSRARGRGGKHSTRSGASKPKPDLRTVLQAKRSSAKRPWCLWLRAYEGSPLWGGSWSGRRILPCLHSSHSQGVPEVCFRGGTLPISGSSLRPGTLTPHFYKVRVAQTNRLVDNLGSCLRARCWDLRVAV